MLTAKTSELEPIEGWFDSDPEHTRVRVTFPINKWARSVDSAAVYLEIEPGNRLPEHTDSAEEILYLVAGDADAQIGDERRRLTAGDLAVIPAMVPHGIVNVGTETVKVVGFFAESEITSTFNEPVQPFGAAVLNQGAPPPAASGSTTGSTSKSAVAGGRTRRPPDRHPAAGGGRAKTRVRRSGTGHQQHRPPKSSNQRPARSDPFPCRLARAVQRRPQPATGRLAPHRERVIATHIARPTAPLGATQ